MSRREEDLRTSDLLPGADRGEHDGDRSAGGPSRATSDQERAGDPGDIERTGAAAPSRVVESEDKSAQAGTAGPVERGGGAAAGGTLESDRALVDASSAQQYQERWMAIQSAFVDEPRQAVAEADGLVAEIIQRLAETFAREREGLEQQWGRGDEVSTEDLRVAMQRYRAFFDRLLTT